MTDHFHSSNAHDERAKADDTTHTNTNSLGDQTQQRARETASNVKDAAWQQAHSQYEQQSGFAAQQAEKMAAALRSMADEFERQEQTTFSGYAKQAAQYSDSVSEKLRDKDLNSIVNEAQDFGRRQPALLVGGAVVTGILLARFLRSSGGARGAKSTANQSSTPRLSCDARPGNAGASEPDSQNIV